MKGGNAADAGEAMRVSPPNNTNSLELEQENTSDQEDKLVCGSPALALLPSDNVGCHDAADNNELSSIHDSWMEADVPSFSAPSFLYEGKAAAHDVSNTACRCGDGYCGCAHNGEGIEYELADYLLLHDIDYLQSRGSLRSVGSSRSVASWEGDSVYGNFDELFVSESEDGNAQIRGSWTSSWGRVDPEGEVEARKDDEGEDEDNARVLKKLVIQCLVRNNHKKNKRDGAEIDIQDRGLPKDPSVSSADSGRRPRDPSASNALDDDEKDADRDPPEVERMREVHPRTREGREEAYHQGAQSVASGSIGPPRPDVVRYSSGTSVASRQTWHPHPETPRSVPNYAVNRVPYQVRTAPTGLSSSGYLTGNHSTLGRSNSHYSGYSSAYDTGGHMRAQCLAGQSELRRQRYKEMLLQQRRQGGTGGNRRTSRNMPVVMEGVAG